ncbi:MAG: hypothetical protein N2109_02635 [Fimbriimonadales bacterium]|nr:hypothetical protein [Fimbriimonadales bacterium]
MRPFRFSKPRTPGYGIAADYYLSVLAGTAVLPAPREVLGPKGEGGAVRGFLVPSAPQTDKGFLQRPLERGSYAAISTDRRTAVRMLVLSTQEAFFDPSVVLRSPAGQRLPEEVRARVSAAWTVLQLSFLSHDPMVQPALEFVCSLAARLAALTDGVVADPLAERYLLPADLAPAAGPRLRAEAHVAVRSEPSGGGLWMHTLGMRKFALAELEVGAVPEELEPVARRLLLGLCQERFDGKRLELGDAVGARSCPLQTAPGGLDRARWEGVACWELIPVRTGSTVADCLRALAPR